MEDLLESVHGQLRVYFIRGSSREAFFSFFPSTAKKAEVPSKKTHVGGAKEDAMDAAREHGHPSWRAFLHGFVFVYVLLAIFRAAASDFSRPKPGRGIDQGTLRHILQKVIRKAAIFRGRRGSPGPKLGRRMAMVHNQWDPILVGRCTTHFSRDFRGDWDVHWGDHGQMCNHF